MQTTVSQKVGMALAGVGALSILGLGWLYVWNSRQRDPPGLDRIDLTGARMAPDILSSSR